MLDIKFIRENKEKIKENCKKRQSKVNIDRLLEVDEKRKKIIQELELINSQKNKANKEIVALKDEKEKKGIISKMQIIDKNNDELKKSFKELNKEFQNLMCQVPNVCIEGVPVGEDETNNVVIRKWGKKPKFSFKPKDYLEISEKLDLIDVKRASKVSGSRFGYLKGKIALMEFALVNLALETLVKEGFTPLVPPVLIKPEMMKAMGYIDSEEDKAERYFFEKDNLYLVGTSEQAIGPMHADEVFEEKELAKRYVGFSTCFREEAGSYGRDTKGILRVHQFDKAEMFSFTKPENSEKEHKYIISIQEKLMKELKLPYQLVQLCTGDIARPSAATYDIETWMPGQNKYRETHSASNCTDFQARRLKIKFRRNNDNKLDFVHTLNGTAFAVGRTLIAIIENYQQKDGSIKVPKVLQKYLGFKVIK